MDCSPRSRLQGSGWRGPVSRRTRRTDGSVRRVRADAIEHRQRRDYGRQQGRVLSKLTRRPKEHIRSAVETRGQALVPVGRPDPGFVLQAAVTKKAWPTVGNLIAAPPGPFDACQ